MEGARREEKEKASRNRKEGKRARERLEGGRVMKSERWQRAPR